MASTFTSPTLRAYSRAATTPCTSSQRGSGTQQHHPPMTSHHTKGIGQTSDCFSTWFSSGILSNIRQKLYIFFWTSNSVLLFFFLNQPGYTCISVPGKALKTTYALIYSVLKCFTPSFCSVSSVNRSRDSFFFHHLRSENIQSLCQTRLKMPKILTIIRQGKTLHVLKANSCVFMLAASEPLLHYLM